MHESARNPWKPDRRDERIPISPPDTVSMNRHSPSHPDPNSAIEEQPLEHPFDVFVGWGFEGFISKVEGFVNQFGADVFVHEAILEAGCARRNS